jgi:hypothetical protein
MDFHVITPTEEQLVMRTERGHVVLVLPAPQSSLPPSLLPVAAPADLEPAV